MVGMDLRSGVVVCNPIHWESLYLAILLQSPLHVHAGDPSYPSPCTYIHSKCNTWRKWVWIDLPVPSTLSVLRFLRCTITIVKTTPTTTAKTPTEPPDIAMTRLGVKETWELAVVTTTGGSDGVGSGVVLATLLPVTPVIMADVTSRDCVGIEGVGWITEEGG